MLAEALANMLAKSLVILLAEALVNMSAKSLLNLLDELLVNMLAKLLVKMLTESLLNMLAKSLLNILVELLGSLLVKTVINMYLKASMNIFLIQYIKYDERSTILKYFLRYSFFVVDLKTSNWVYDFVVQVWHLWRCVFLSIWLKGCKSSFLVDGQVSNYFLIIVKNFCCTKILAYVVSCSRS